MSNIFLLVHPVMDLQKAWIIIRQQSSEEREFPLKTWKLQESLCLIWLIQPHKILNLFMCLFHRTDFLFQIFMVLLINYTFSQAKKQKQKTHTQRNIYTSLSKQVLSPDRWTGESMLYSAPTSCIKFGLPWLTLQMISGVYFSGATLLWNSKLQNHSP